jgi:hypothetical protein
LIKKLLVEDEVEASKNQLANKGRKRSGVSWDSEDSWGNCDTEMFGCEGPKIELANPDLVDDSGK